MNLEEYAQHLFQDVLAESDADGQFLEDTFFQKVTELLVEAGELECADRSEYKSPSKGIRVDGYGGDPEDTAGILSLIVLDFHPNPTTKRLVGSELNTIFRRLLNYLRHTRDLKWREALEETSPAYGLSDLIASSWNAISKVRFLLVSNRILSERVDGRTEDSLDERPITYTVWDLKRIHSLAVAGSSREDLVVDLKKDFGGAIPILPARQSDDDLESYLAALPGEVLANIYDRWGARLLEQNVRVFLQTRGKVNKAIRKTLEYEPNMFFAFNNGITATAEALEIQDDGDQMRLCSLKNFQIVNGGQTTASIHVAKLNGVDISRTFVQMKLSIVDSERATSLVPKISEYANSQNRVTAADFFSNHPFHVRIEEFSRRMFAPSPEGSFRQSKWFYERARGQYADARARLSRSQRKKFDLEYPRNQLLTKTDLAKHWNVWECRPHEVSLGAQKNFAAFARRIDQAWEKSPNDFSEVWFREAIAKSIVFKATERIVSAQSWYQGGYRANIVAYSIAKIAYDIVENGKAMDFTTIWRMQTITSSMMKSLELVAREIHDVLTNPPDWISNVTEWAKKEQCWTKARNRDIEWIGELGGELISKEEQIEIREDGKKDQRILNGIEAQIAVVNAGAQFWADALEWGKARNLLTPTEVGILEVATRIPTRTPTEKQSTIVLELLERLQSENFQARI